MGLYRDGIGRQGMSPACPSASSVPDCYCPVMIRVQMQQINEQIDMNDMMQD